MIVGCVKDKSEGRGNGSMMMYYEYDKRRKVNIILE